MGRATRPRRCDRRTARLLRRDAGALNLTPEVHALRVDATVVTTLITAPSNDGAPVEIVMRNLLHLGPHGIDRIETWAADGLDDALAAFHGSAALNDLSNRCTAAQLELGRAVERRDWEAMRARFAPEFDGRDDRTGFVSSEGDPAENYRVAAELGITQMACTPIALRGETVALAEVTFRGAGDHSFEVRVLTVNEIDADGRFVYQSSFDVDALDDAIADLERRYMEGEGAPNAEMLELVLRGTIACNARDWDALRVLYAPHIVSVNAGFASGWGTSTDRETLVDAIAQMYTIWAGARSLVREIVACSRDTVVCTTVTAANADGASSEIVHQIVYHRAGAAIDRMEVFDDAHLDDALAAYRRLTAAAAEPSNRSSRR